MIVQTMEIVWLISRKDKVKCVWGLQKDGEKTFKNTKDKHSATGIKELVP